MDTSTKIDIVLATYNAAKFLAEQLDSIINQDYKEWQLIISDDGSNDKTIKIINDYVAKYPNKIKLLPFVKKFGAKANFNFLLQHTKSNYICFADHDDIWFKDKLSMSLDALKKAELKDKQIVPALVFTDKSVTDDNLNIIHLSHTKSEKFNTKNIKLNSLLVQNIASGCTMMINKKLKNIVGIIPNIAVMHDHYIILLAKIFGEVRYIDKPTMLYRQHSANEIGATSYNLNYIINRVKKGRKQLNDDFCKRINQSKYITTAYSNISEENYNILTEFNKLADARFFKFRYILIKGGYLKSGFLRKIGMLVLL